MDQFINLDTPTLWALVVAIFAPTIIAVIQQAKWSARIRSLVAFAFYLAVAAVTVWLSGGFDIGNFIKTALIVFLVGDAMYRAVWKPTGATPAIEAATNLPDSQPKHSA